MVEELPFVDVDLGHQNIIIVDEEGDKRLFGGGGGNPHGHYGDKPGVVRHDTVKFDFDELHEHDYEPVRRDPKPGRRRRRRRKRPRGHFEEEAELHNEVGGDEGGFDPLFFHHSDHFDHAGYVHGGHHSHGDDDHAHAHPNDVGGYRGGGFDHDGFTHDHGEPPPPPQTIKHDYHGKHWAEFAAGAVSQ